MMAQGTSERIASAYFDEVQKAFDRATDISGGCIIRQYRIGRRILQLSFAGPALMPLLCPAFEHLAKNSRSHADFEILLWDAKSTGVAMPKAPWEIEEIIRRGEIWRVDHPNVKVNFNPHNSTHDLINLSKNLGIFHASATHQISQHDSSSPVLQILRWWFNTQGQYVIHAGAVGTPDGGVLLAGKGGSGKSTTALLCIKAGLGYVGDDCCLLDKAEAPYIHSLYSSAKVNLSKLDWFPFLTKNLSPFPFPDADKALFLLNQGRSSQILLGFPIKAVLLPQVTGLPKTTLSPASPARALLALAPSTMFQFRSTTTDAFEGMSRLVRQVPCFDLKLGTDLSTIPNVLRQYLL